MMTFLFKILLVLVVLLACEASALEIVNDPVVLKTSLGIKITISQAAIKQYGSYWKQYGFEDASFWDIDFDRMDLLFTKLNEAYETVGIADPKKVSVRILGFDETWVDDEAPTNHDGTIGREMIYGRGHIDGAYPGYVLIHLGDVSPAILFPCQSAADYELGHYFLRGKKDGCWYNEFSANCSEHYIFANEVQVCP